MLPLPSNVSIRVHDLNGSDPVISTYRSPDEAPAYYRAGIISVIACKECETSGGVVYEYFMEPTIKCLGEDHWNRRIYRFVDRDSQKKHRRSYADVNDQLHVMTDDGEPSHPIARTADYWIIDVDGVLNPPKYLTTKE